MFDKILGAMSLGDDDDDDDYVENDIPTFQKRPEKPVSESRASVAGAERTKPVKMNKPVKKNGSSPMEIVAIKPTSFDDAREIAETLLAERAVILNMDGLDFAVAQRIIDFVCGATFAIEGNLQMVSSYIYIITPPSVELSGDMQGIVDAFDFSGLHANI